MALTVMGLLILASALLLPDETYTSVRAGPGREQYPHRQRSDCLVIRIYTNICLRTLAIMLIEPDGEE
jgi:hypothetical protein